MIDPNVIPDILKPNTRPGPDWLTNGWYLFIAFCGLVGPMAVAVRALYCCIFEDEENSDL